MRIVHIKDTIRSWSNKFEDCFLKTQVNFEFQILLLSSFYSIAVDGPKENSCLTLNKMMLL